MEGKRGQERAEERVRTPAALGNHLTDRLRRQTWSLTPHCPPPRPELRWWTRSPGQARGQFKHFCSLYLAFKKGDEWVVVVWWGAFIFCSYFCRLQANQNKKGRNAIMKQTLVTPTAGLNKSQNTEQVLPRAQCHLLTLCKVLRSSSALA